MTKEERDKEFSQKITELTGEIWTGRYDLKGLGTLENKIFAEIRKDRKHQKSEMLKRLPSELEITTILVSHSGVGMSKAIHKLAEEKLK